MYNENPDIVVLTEIISWDNFIPSSIFACCETYNIFRKDHSTRGGGVCVLVKKCSHIAVHQVSVVPDNSDLEIVAVDLSDNTDSQPLRLIAVSYDQHKSS